ncbi:MAG TPA: response regulator [Opitutaceae bacterium]|nr:response regulator [Opitutaceae bacterium]
MRYKILTVDDSKTVRIIVRKAFRGFDCEIIEASNGAEGLTVAAKESPDLILLDVTMPVMDGVEMLSKLKATPALKGIPVIMLTAEGGRDNVLKIAKIGVRDYLVKPFKEEVLVEKARRVIDLAPLAAEGARARTIFDPADILLVEDKPAIVQQFKDGLKHTPWKIHVATTQLEATEIMAHTPPDVMAISLSLTDDFAFTLFRIARTNPKSKLMPIFALVPKVDLQQQQQAQTVGFNGVFATPLAMPEIENKIAKAMNLDTSLRYYAIEGDALVLRMAENCPPARVTEAANFLKPKLAEAAEAGRKKLIVDLNALTVLPLAVVKLLLLAVKTAGELGARVALVANAKIAADAKNSDETRSLVFHDSLENAKASLSMATENAPQLAPS